MAGATLTEDPAEAVAGAHALYADVWVSMGDEDTADERREALQRLGAARGVQLTLHKGRLTEQGSGLLTASAPAAEASALLSASDGATSSWAQAVAGTANIMAKPSEMIVFDMHSSLVWTLRLSRRLRGRFYCLPCSGRSIRSCTARYALRGDTPVQTAT